MRKIGLGVMGLAQLYVQLGIKYGSDEGNEVASQLMTHINHGAKATSHELARERGSFNDWNESKYANPTEYREWFERQTGESADDWEDGFPIRNHNVTTIAPTGTTSMVGNTTGGCEPIYNVAYYKNVTDDVQGDEMLVEFDDYFLRVLEDNDIDIDAVKEEAQDQMATNQFDGVEGLSTVPDAIGELFVITSDVSAKQHAAVQCACQNGVDSAISKTVNAPNDSTLEDAKEVFEWVYENGGKGVTYYRDGTRSKQVLTTRADNADFADETEAAQALVEQIDEIFGGLEAFLESQEVQDILEEDVDALLGDSRQPVQVDFTEKRERPDALQGVSQRIDTGYGKIYVTINEDPETGQPFELFANIGHPVGSRTPSPRRSRRSSRPRCVRASTPRRSLTNSVALARRRWPGTRANRFSPSPTPSAPRCAGTSRTRSISRTRNSRRSRSRPTRISASTTGPRPTAARPPRRAVRLRLLTPVLTPTLTTRRRTSSTPASRRSVPTVARSRSSSAKDAKPAIAVAGRNAER